MPSPHNIAHIHRHHKPKTFTTSEEIIEEMSNRLLASGKTYKQIAALTGLSPSTVANIASRKTRWPRPHTFFRLLAFIGMKLRLVE